MDKYEVVNGEIQTKPIPVDVSVVQGELDDAKNNLQQTQDAKVKANDEFDATIAHWTEQVAELGGVIGEAGK